MPRSFGTSGAVDAVPQCRKTSGGKLHSELLPIWIRHRYKANWSVNFAGRSAR